jgi:hypothetical protein
MSPDTDEDVYIVHICEFGLVPYCEKGASKGVFKYCTFRVAQDLKNQACEGSLLRLSIENDERVKKWRFMLLFHKLIMTCLQQKMYMLQTGTFTKDENHAPLDVQLFDAMLGI